MVCDIGAGKGAEEAERLSAHAGRDVEKERGDSREEGGEGLGERTIRGGGGEMGEGVASLGGGAGREQGDVVGELGGGGGGGDVEGLLVEDDGWGWVLIYARLQLLLLWLGKMGISDLSRGNWCRFGWMVWGVLCQL